MEAPAPTRRLVWIDWLRVIAVLLIFAFHSARVYNAGELFYAKSVETSSFLSWFVVGFFSFWQMPLLFLLAGMSSYFALGKRTGGQFLKERALRLLVPFFFGVFVIVPPQTWYGARTNAGYTGSLAQFYVDYFSLKWGLITDYRGGPSYGHLWFILYLFIASAVALPLFLWIRRGPGESVGVRLAGALAKPWWWVVVAFGLLLTTALPEFGGHNLFNYVGWFVLGFLLVAGRGPLEAARRWKWVLLGVALPLAWLVAATYDVRDRYPDPSFPIAVNEFGVQLVGWLLCLAAIGIGMTYLDRSTKALPYLAEASYPTYILHQTVIVVIGFYLVQALPQPLVSWAVLTAGSIAVTYGIYEVFVRRWRPMRFLFGMRPKPRERTG
jgi:peptidoglycan/LPS O-acetylase OafA/YrhL